MPTTTSTDGTTISYGREGSGPPIVLVHGTGGDREDFAGLRPLLAESATVYDIDRRGRGASGDGGDYRLEREYEDLVAVIEAVGEPVTLLGHSFGGLCALEAALRTDRVEALVLYEPILPAGPDPLAPEALVERVDQLADHGQYDKAFRFFAADIAQIPTEQIDAIADTPVWENVLKTVPTIPRELRALNDYRFQPDRFADLQTPTTVIVGEQSPEFMRQMGAMLADLLPAGCRVELADQGHLGVMLDPEGVAEIVGNGLRG